MHIYMGRNSWKAGSFLIPGKYEYLEELLANEGKFTYFVHESMEVAKKLQFPFQEINISSPVCKTVRIET